MALNELRPIPHRTLGKPSSIKSGEPAGISNVRVLRYEGIEATPNLKDKHQRFSRKWRQLTFLNKEINDA